MTGGPDVWTQALSGASGLPQPRKIIRADIDVAQNASQRTNFESRVPVDRHGCSDLLAQWSSLGILETSPSLLPWVAEA